ncbi:MAG: substrate-binding periplasmic protein [Gemmatimonadales bacterium]
MNASIAAVALFLACGSCDFPRDASHALERIHNGTLRVGVIHHPPWVLARGGELQGVEVQLIRAAAADLKAKIAWVSGSESELLSSLHERELDLVIGGLSRTSPWKHQVAFSRAYYVDSTIVSSPAGSRESSLKHDSVAVEAGDPATADLRKKGAIPISVNQLAGIRGLVAAPAWQLSLLGRPPTGIVLRTDERTMALSPGENAWLNWLERWLYGRQQSVPAMLRSVSP